MWFSASDRVAIKRALTLALPAAALAGAACTQTPEASAPVSSPTVTTSSSAISAAPVIAASSSKPAVSSPAPAAPGSPATVVTATSWSEQFSAADNSSFMSAAYAAQPGNAAKPLYAPAAGSARVADGVLTLANARFTVGALGNTATSATTSPGGIFALSEKSCKLALNVLSASGSGNFYVYVDNNTTGQDNSPRGKASRVVAVGAAKLLPGLNTLNWSLKKSDFAGGSFLQLRADSGANLVIDSISMHCE